MVNPLTIIERRAKELYRAYRKKRLRGAFGIPTPGWDALTPNGRECWRREAVASMRSEESVLDELKREDRERQRKLSERVHGDTA